MSAKPITFFDNVVSIKSSDIVSVKNSEYLQLDVTGTANDFKIKVYAQVIEGGDFLPLAIIGNNSFKIFDTITSKGFYRVDTSGILNIRVDLEELSDGSISCKGTLVNIGVFGEFVVNADVEIDIGYKRAEIKNASATFEEIIAVYEEGKEVKFCGKMTGTDTIVIGRLIEISDTQVTFFLGSNEVLGDMFVYCNYSNYWTSSGHKEVLVVEMEVEDDGNIISDTDFLEIRNAIAYKNHVEAIVFFPKSLNSYRFFLHTSGEELIRFRGVIYFNDAESVDPEIIYSQTNEYMTAELSISNQNKKIAVIAQNIQNITVVNLEIDKNEETGEHIITPHITYDEMNTALSNGQVIVANILVKKEGLEIRTANVCHYENYSPIRIVAENLLEQYEIVVLDDNTWSVAIVELASRNYVNTRINYQIGDIETALDSIIAIQNQLMGVSE